MILRGGSEKQEKSADRAVIVCLFWQSRRAQTRGNLGKEGRLILAQTWEGSSGLQFKDLISLFESTNVHIPAQDGGTVDHFLRLYARGNHLVSPGVQFPVVE